MRCLLQRLKAALLLFDAAVESCAATVRSATMSNAAVLLVEALDVLFAALTADAVRSGAAIVCSSLDVECRPVTGLSGGSVVWSSECCSAWKRRCYYLK